MNGGRFLIIGSGERMSSCADTLADKGFSVGIISSASAYINGWDHIILPLPTLSGGLICGTDIPLSHVLSGLGGARLFYGNAPESSMPENAVSYCAAKRFIDINSDLTARGVILTAGENDISLDGGSVAVIGYGNCGRAICRELKSFTNDITVYARSPGATQAARKPGCSSGDFAQLEAALKKHDVIINTVPAHILDRAVRGFGKNNVYIEIASEPFGFDASVTDTSGFKYIKAPGLPGKYFPRESGALIADTVLELIGEGKNE